MKNKAVIGVFLCMVVMTAALYMFMNRDGKPGPLPDENRIMSVIDAKSGEISVKQLLEVNQLDSKHAYIPFVSMQDEYGMSFWKWEKRQWRLSRVNVNGMPHIWILDKNPVKRVIVYNIDPKEQLERMSFYLIRDRNAYGHNNQFFYVPRIQMELTVPVDGNRYGAISIPEEWAQLMKEDKKLTRLMTSPSMFSTSNSMMYIGWQQQYKEGAEPLGQSYSMSGGLDVEFIRYVNEKELE